VRQSGFVKVSEDAYLPEEFFGLHRPGSEGEELDLYVGGKWCPSHPGARLAADPTALSPQL